VDIGVFIPINNNGWIISATSPQYMPSFELNKSVVLKAERYGLDFALSMIKLHGFGGKTEFWDHGLESFTLMAGLASVTARIRLYASVAVLTIPPAIVARMASTIADISGGRFGVNIVSGWHKIEYSQMGVWPGDDHFGKRYDYSTEYMRVMQELWTGGHSDFRGEYFKMDACKLSPRPVDRIKLVAAGQSDRGMEFAAQYCDFNFALGEGVNEPTKAAAVPARMLAHAEKTGRDVGSYMLYMIIADETDDAAMRKWSCTTTAPTSTRLPICSARQPRIARRRQRRWQAPSSAGRCRSISTWERWSAPTPRSLGCWTRRRRCPGSRASCSPLTISYWAWTISGPASSR
jgi:pyrimidine oxygenase